MSRRAEYRLKALACAEAAERTSDLLERVALLEIADAWVKLAEHSTAPPDLPGDELPSRHLK